MNDAAAARGRAHQAGPGTEGLSGQDTEERLLQSEFDRLLGSLPIWHPARTSLPSFDTDSAPADPLPLFHRWFAGVAAAGQPEPQTVSLATTGPEGRPDVRTVMLHGADRDGWSFATQEGSRKVRDLETRPYAALNFYWSTQGRAVRVRGRVHRRSDEAAAADLRARSTASLASALVGRQSEVLDSYGELVRASERAWDRAGRDPLTEAPSWTLHLLVADEIEFFQGDAHRRHIRLRYRRETTGGHGTEGDSGNSGGNGSPTPDARRNGHGGTRGTGTRDTGTWDTGAWVRELLWP